MQKQLTWLKAEIKLIEMSKETQFWKLKHSKLKTEINGLNKSLTTQKNV